MVNRRRNQRNDGHCFSTLAWAMTQLPLSRQLRYFGRNRTSAIFHSTSSPNNSSWETNRVFSSCSSQLHPAFISYVTWWNINSLELVSPPITMKNADIFGSFVQSSELLARAQATSLFSEGYKRKCQRTPQQLFSIIPQNAVFLA